MSRRFPPACESAPAPALLVWVDAGTVRWLLNGAAREWLATLHWEPADWDGLARRVLDSPEGRESGDDASLTRLQWQATPVDDGAWLAWLASAHDARALENQALREQVAHLQDHLQLVQDIGRLGVWERDIAHGHSRWDEHMFRFFGFDPQEALPTVEEAMLRLHPDDRAQFHADYFGSMQHAGRYDGRYRVPLAHGEEKLLHAVWEVKAGPDGRPERLIGVMLDDTESIKVAKKQHAASVQLTLAGGLVGMSLWRVDLAAQRIQLNDWGYELIGRAPHPDGVPLAVMRGFVHPDDRAGIVRATAAAVAGHRVVDAEARYRRADGSYRTLLTRRIAERDADGRAIALVGVSLDVTEQVKDRERAREVTQSLDLIAGATGVGVWSADLDTREVHWNGQMRRIYGVDDGVAVPLARAQALEMTHPEDRERLGAAYDQLLQGGAAPDEVEFRVLRADGSVRWVVGRARRAQHGDRRVAFGVLIDVTEQRSTQERLRRAEQRTLLAAKAVGLAIWERDIVSGDAWWDAHMYRLRGLSPDDPRTPNELRYAMLHPDDVAFFERRTAAILEGEVDYTFDFRVRWPDGSVRWLATRGSVARDHAGRAQRIIGFNWDITEQKRGEDMRREKAAAEQASRAKSEFLSRMSHELRTPLNAVLGFAQLMLDDPGQGLPAKQRERSERIRDAGRHLLSLIDDVLDLTSVETGGVPVSTAPVAIQPVVEETLQWVAPAARQAQVTLLASALRGAVLADTKRLRQVLTNLLSNAVKYNRPQGRVEISVLEDEGTLAGHGGWLGIRVRDSGRGLTAAQMKRLFEPFNRLGAEREGIEGTGIGLSIVRALVNRMGGRIDVDSRPGEGSEFTVWLLRAPAQAAGEPEAATSAEDARPAAAGRAIDVLYIEDNAVNVLLVRELMALRPHIRLHVAIDGRSGIAHAQSLRPRAVLIDLQLPDIDGFAVLRALRADDRLAGTECIALSANAMPDDVARATRAGFDDYWTKPIDFSQFLGGLDRLSAGA
jgi:PAS domain S-box-containing protein